MNGSIESTRGERIAIRPEIEEWFKKGEPEESVEPEPEAAPVRKNVTEVRLTKQSETSYRLLVIAEDGERLHIDCPDRDGLRDLRVLLHATKMRWDTQGSFWRDKISPLLLSRADQGYVGLWTFTPSSERRRRRRHAQEQAA